MGYDTALLRDIFLQLTKPLTKLLTKPWTKPWTKLLSTGHSQAASSQLYKFELNQLELNHFEVNSFEHSSSPPPHLPKTNSSYTPPKDVTHQYRIVFDDGDKIYVKLPDDDVHIGRHLKKNTK